MTRYDLLLSAFEQADSPPPSNPGAFRGLPAAGCLPSPWETWTLIGLVRHRRRQLWVGEIVTTRLQGSRLDLARLGALAHPEGVPQQGPVPGLPEWEYYFHGRGCCLTHRVTGETIDVDFFDDSSEYFDFYFYEQYLKLLRTPEPPEERLLALHPSIRPLRIAVDDLLLAGLLTPFPGRESFPFRLSEAILEFEEEIVAFCAAWADPARRAWLAALIGDWPGVQEAALLAGNADLTVLAGERAEQDCELRRGRLREEAPDEIRAAAALQGLADLGAADLPGALVRALEGPASGLTSTALAAIDRSNDSAWCGEVYRLFQRMSPARPIPEPHIWITSLQFLLRHDYHGEEVLATLPQAAGHVLGEALLLALERAPQFVLPLARRALRSTIPLNRTAAAAILALIDRPWSRRELIAVLAESTDQEQTADCRAALLECHAPEVHQTVQSWEECNPHEPERGVFVEIDGRQVGPCFSMAEQALRNSGGWLRHEMEKLHDRVMAVRDRLPPGAEA